MHSMPAQSWKPRFANSRNARRNSQYMHINECSARQRSSKIQGAYNIGCFDSSVEVTAGRSWTNSIQKNAGLLWEMASFYMAVSMCIFYCICLILHAVQLEAKVTDPHREPSKCEGKTFEHFVLLKWRCRPRCAMIILGTPLPEELWKYLHFVHNF